MRMIVAAKTRMNSACQQPPSARLHAQGGHQDSSRLLGESCRPKKWGATRAKILNKKEQNRELATEWAVGGLEAHGQLMLSANVRRLGTRYKRSKIAFAVTSVTFIDVHICTELFELPAQSLIGSPGTLRAGVTQMWNYWYWYSQSFCTSNQNRCPTSSSACL